MNDLYVDKKITVQAPSSTVWKVLVEKRYNEQWICEFSEGNIVTEDWQLNSNIVMTNDDGTTLSEGIITEFKPNRQLKVEFNNSAYTEELTLTAEGDRTVLSGHAGPVGQAEHKKHSEIWEKGLSKIKELAEGL